MQVGEPFGIEGQTFPQEPQLFRPTTQASTPAATTTATPTRHLFNNLQLQALSDQRACFNCEQLGHIALNCPLKPKDPTLVIQEVDASADAEPEREEP